MEPKRNVEHKYTYNIGSGKDYRDDITGEMLKKAAELIQPTDKIVDIHHKETLYSNWGGYQEDEGKVCYIPVIVVSRWEEETDKEYEERMRMKVQQEEQSEKRDRLEYLRLKAKYETEHR